MSVEKMRDDQKNKAELLQEMETLRKRVAELKQTQEALRKSEEKWHSLLNNTPDIVMIVDRDGTIRFINHTVPGIKEQEATGKRVYDYISPEHHDTMRKDLERVFQTGQGASQEISGVGPHGSLSRYQAQLRPIKQDGRIVAASIVTRDITERKRADEEIRTSDERFRNLAERSFDLIFMTDAQGCLTYISAASEKIFQYKPEEMVGTHFKNYLVKSEIYRVSQRFAENFKGENLGIFQMEAMRKDGGRVFIELNSSPIVKDGAKIGIQGIIRDITERKNTEQSLRESEERLRAGLSAAQMGTWRWDPATNQDTRDASFNGILGLEAVESTQPVEDFLQHVHPEDREMVDAEIQRSLREHCTYVAEFRIVRPDGTVRWLRDQGKPLYDEDDHILCLTGAVVDITERKRAEEALRESEKRYRSLFQGAAEGIIVADIETMEFKYVNSAICKMLGFTEEEFKEFSLPDIHRKEDLEYVISEFKAQAQGKKTFSPNIPFLRKDGTIMYADVNTTNTLIDGRQCNVGFFTDITERKQAEETLRESEERYRTLVESAGESIVMVNKDGVHLFMNETAAKRLGGKPEDYVGKTIWDAFPKKMADRQMAIIRKVISKGEGINSISPTEVQGQFRWFNATIEPLRDGSGKVTAAMVIARDIHELKLAEEELGLYREKMAHAERLASLGTLSATLAHELNQPLTAIRLSIENSLVDLETISCPGSVIEDLSDSLSAVSDVTSKVDSLRHFAQESSKEIISEVDLKSVAERILNLLNESARRARVSLHIKGMDQLSAIYSNEKDLEQLFFALVENAIQATDGKKSRRLIISGGVKDEHIELRFADDCCGIAPENLDKIFEPFFTTSPAGEGTGLGLCIVERIVSEAGGKIRVESKAGKGSTFFVTLPLEKGRMFE
ncbi:MAG: PAS domain S-box protein [Sedimentisphaerales bacterium]